MSEQEMEAMKALDEAAEKAGGYLSPFFDSKTHYDYRKILAYAFITTLDNRDYPK